MPQVLGLFKAALSTLTSAGMHPRAGGGMESRGSRVIPPLPPLLAQDCSPAVSWRLEKNESSYFLLQAVIFHDAVVGPCGVGECLCCWRKRRFMDFHQAVLSLGCGCL